MFDFYVSLFMLNMWVTIISFFDCSHVSISFNVVTHTQRAAINFSIMLSYSWHEIVSRQI